mmetsp:Transcript_50199/g.60573  ORF Transcript_50199/g.60573 Transcript_50199/m.60573 type:complete len:185 (+) Transcript_50199:145-699(+)
MPPDDDAPPKLLSLIRNENETRKMRHRAILNKYDCKVLLHKKNLFKYGRCETERHLELVAEETTLRKLNLRSTHLSAAKRRSHRKLTRRVTLVTVHEPPAPATIMNGRKTRWTAPARRNGLCRAMDHYRRKVMECPLSAVTFAERVAREHETAKLLAGIRAKVAGFGRSWCGRDDDFGNASFFR